MSKIHFHLHFLPFQIQLKLTFFFKMTASLVGCSRLIFFCIFRHFKSKCNLNFFFKMATGGHFGYPKLIFVCISHHSRSKYNFQIFQNGCPAAILDGRNLFSIKAQLSFYSHIIRNHSAVLPMVADLVRCKQNRQHFGTAELFLMWLKMQNLIKSDLFDLEK